jgi:ribosomal protein S18 acetylase RimI-like enzyme
MIELREMATSEFDAYRVIFIGEYAEDLEANYGYTVDEAKAAAEADIAEAFPNGPRHSTNLLNCIDLINGKSRTMVGYVWYRLNGREPAFLSDFYIKPEYRGKGLGGKVLAVLEMQLKKLGIQELRLRVAGDNPRAKDLYAKVGFRPTGTNMAKKL